MNGCASRQLTKYSAHSIDVRMNIPLSCFTINDPHGEHKLYRSDKNRCSFVGAFSVQSPDAMLRLEIEEALAFPHPYRSYDWFVDWEQMIGRNFVSLIGTRKCGEFYGDDLHSSLVDWVEIPVPKVVVDSIREDAAGGLSLRLKSARFLNTSVVQDDSDLLGFLRGS